jgi:Ca2+-binding RTX toxin-like protein
MNRVKRLTPLLTVFGCFLVAAPGASAAVKGHIAAAFPFGCRASLARVDLGGTPIEPIVANTNTYPCLTQSAGVSTLTVPNGGDGNITAGPAGAFTYETGSIGGATAPGAAAAASVQGVNLPDGQGTVTIVGPVQANAGVECVNDQVVSKGQSTLQVIYVNGQKDTLPSPGAPETIQLGGGAYLALNEKISTADSLTERVLDLHLATGTDVILGEAEVTWTGPTACQGANGTPPTLQLCPTGTTLDPSAEYCILNNSTPGGTKIVYVSRPFGGGHGGTYYTLAAARKKFHSPCLSGPGPKYVLVATKVGGRVTGTPQSDRILALGARERVAGLAGNDCIDGRGGNQRIFDGNGKDRVWASGGFNRVGLGRGNDYFNGRNGSDWFTIGNGQDTVYGGQGNSRIDVGIGHDKIFGGKGVNRIWAGGDSAKVNCGSGGHNEAFVRPRAAGYAAAHGCERIIKLK